MLKNVVFATAIAIAAPAFASAQDIFWSFSPTSVSSDLSDSRLGDSGSAYIFSDGLFGVDALDLEFTSGDASQIHLTGGEAFNPTFDVIGNSRFNSTELTIDAAGDSGNLFSVSVSAHGVDPVLGPMFDPGFEAGVGPNGAVLLARVDFTIAGTGVTTLDFNLGPMGAVQTLPTRVLNPSFGSPGLLIVSRPLTTYLGDVNIDSSIDFLDISHFVWILSIGAFQWEADIDQNGAVDFLDIFPFIEILSSQ